MGGMRPLALAALVFLSACTPAQRETSAREWAMTECNRMIDHVERERCAKRADQAYGTAGVESRTPPPR